jgi:hypothetical protein
MWWPFRKNPTFKKSPRATQDLSPQALAETAKHRDLYELLELFLVRRVETELSLEEKRAEVRLKTAEADAQTKLKLEEIKAQRRQLRATQMAERNRTAPRDTRGRVTSWRNVRGVDPSCAVCANPSSPHLTVEQIRLHHAQGHTDGSVPPNGSGPAGS